LQHKSGLLAFIKQSFADCFQFTPPRANALSIIKKGFAVLFQAPGTAEEPVLIWTEQSPLPHTLAANPLDKELDYSRQPKDKSERSRFRSGFYK